MQLTNEKLYELCKKYGAQARFWRQKFIGLLPEMNKRRLYEAKGFQSIFEFAAKLCGLSTDQVRLALNLEKRFEDKPVLKKMLENGEASINKLTWIASIATPENEEELAEKIKVLPKSALDTWVRDVKKLETDQALPGQTAEALMFEMADDVKAEFNELYSRGIDVNEFLREILKQRRIEISDAKKGLAEITRPAKSRYIPIKIKNILKQEYGDKCSIATCLKPAKVIHHTQRFSLSQDHNPQFLAPLCSDHHIIAHSIDLKYHESRLPTH